jgi:hypothetical protein
MMHLQHCDAVGFDVFAVKMIISKDEALVFFAYVDDAFVGLVSE